MWLYWPPEQNFLSLSAGNGVVERYGPQMIPLSGRGYAQADVRIHAIDPLDRSFWPFPATPVTTNDNDRPPAPGEQAQPYDDNGPIDTQGLQGQIARLGSPSVSALQVLPLSHLGSSARFGLDLHDAFARISGRDNPGTYLVGVRALDQPGTRNWMRVQVSDLSLTTVEEEDSVRFVVTSLSTGQPVAGAKIEVDAVDYNGRCVIATGTTGTDGIFVTRESGAINPAGAPPVRVLLTHAGIQLNYTVGDIVEDHLEVVNPELRHYVAITVPLAASMEPLDPALLTAPPEAKPSAPPTLTPSYVAFLDDRVSYYYDSLPPGTYDFYFRTKAAVPDASSSRPRKR